MNIKMSHKLISLILSICLLFTQTGFAQVAGEMDISSHLLALRNSFIKDTFRPLHLRYISYDTLSNNFNLLLDKGDLKKGLSPQALKGLSPKGTDPEGDISAEASKLMQYFFIGISLPNESFWVNLRPDSPDNIIDDELAKTDIGKIFLEADLQLKKDTALFTSPQTPEGKEYWNKLYKKAEELYGYENITIPTLTRPWIVPDEIIIRESKDNAYIYKATLKVMLESDYLSSQAAGDTFHQASNEAVNRKVSPGLYEFKDSRSKALNEYSSQLIRELIIPKITKEVNSSKRYAPLRQVYYSLILAQWFKQRFRQGLSPSEIKGLSPKGTDPSFILLINSQNLTNLISKEHWSKTTYFNEYKKSFAKGEYNIKEPVYTPTGQVIRSYFSGGIKIDNMSPMTFNIAGSPVGNKPYLIPMRVDKNGIVTQQFAGSPAENYDISQAGSPISIKGWVVTETSRSEYPPVTDVITDLDKEWVKEMYLDLKSLPVGTLIYLGDTGQSTRGEEGGGGHPIRWLVKIEKGGMIKLWYANNKGCFIGSVKSLGSFSLIEGRKTFTPGRIEALRSRFEIDFPYYEFEPGVGLLFPRRTWTQDFKFFRVLYPEKTVTKARAGASPLTPQEHLVNDLIINLKILNKDLIRSLEILKSDFSSDNLASLTEVVWRIKAALGTFSKLSGYAGIDSDIILAIMDVLVNRINVLDLPINLWSEQEIPETGKRIQDYITEFRNLELIVAAGELDNIKYYHGSNHFINIDKLREAGLDKDSRGTSSPAAADSAKPGASPLVTIKDGKQWLNIGLFESILEGKGVVVGSGRYLADDNGFVPISNISDLDVFVFVKREDVESVFGGATVRVMHSILEKLKKYHRVETEWENYSWLKIKIEDKYEFKAHFLPTFSIDQVVKDCIAIQSLNVDLITKHKADRGVDSVDWLKRYLSAEYYLGDMQKHRNNRDAFLACQNEADMEELRKKIIDSGDLDKLDEKESIINFKGGYNDAYKRIKELIFGRAMAAADSNTAASPLQGKGLLKLVASAKRIGGGTQFKGVYACFDKEGKRLPFVVKVPSEYWDKEKLFKDEVLEYAKGHLGEVFPPFNVVTGEDAVWQGEKYSFIVIEKLLPKLFRSYELPKEYTLSNGKKIDLQEKKKDILLNLVKRGAYYNDISPGTEYGLDTDTGELHLVDFEAVLPRTEIDGLVKRLLLRVQEETSFLYSLKELHELWGVDYGKRFSVPDVTYEQKTGSSPLGGIDMRYLAKNTVIENRDSPLRGQSLFSSKGQSPSGTDPKELEEIQRLIQAGIIPATRRLEECSKSCQADALLSCIADILRIEEERVTPTEAGLKNLLASL